MCFALKNKKINIFTWNQCVWCVICAKTLNFVCFLRKIIKSLVFLWMCVCSKGKSMNLWEFSLKILEMCVFYFENYWNLCVDCWNKSNFRIFSRKNMEFDVVSAREYVSTLFNVARVDATRKLSWRQHFLIKNVNFKTADHKDSADWYTRTYMYISMIFRYEIGHRSTYHRHVVLLYRDPSWLFTNSRLLVSRSSINIFSHLPWWNLFSSTMTERSIYYLRISTD